MPPLRMLRCCVAFLALATVAGLQADPLAQAGRDRPVLGETCAKDLSPTQLDSRIDAVIARMTLKERIDQLQDRAPAIPRLGLSAYNWWNEGLHGLARDGYATVFPQAIGLAATWDADLLHGVGESVSTEARQHFARHAGSNSPRYAGLTIWSPNINLFRDPRWGRGQETYGEDPVLTGSLAVQFVRGVQGDDPFYLRADATPKHFAVHSGPEEGRDSFNAVVSQQDLDGSYFRAFHQVTASAQPAALMCSYNEINGTPSCASQANLQTMLRDRWGFHGYVVSDCDAVGDIHAFHHYAPDAAHAAAMAINAGVDLDCGNTYSALQQSVAQGLVKEQTINNALHRLLLARARLGLLDASACSPYAAQPGPDIEQAHAALALRAAEESAVLLKNDGTLPLKPGRSIAVIGPTADMLRVLEANYHGTARSPVTLLQGIQAAFPEMRYAQGSTLADGVAVPVPRSALHSSAEAGASAGLKAEYFKRAEIIGEPDETVTVPTIDLDIDRAGPTPAITTKHFAARWTGVLQTPATGDFTVRINVERCWDCTEHDSYRLYVDDRVLVNDGTKAEPNTLLLHDSKPTAHRIRLEYLHRGDDEGIALEWLPDTGAMLEEAIAAARAADVIVAVVGLSPDLEGEALQLKVAGFNGGDRTTLGLPAVQLQLLRRLQELHKPMVLVLTSGSALSLDEKAQQANAILEAWYPGQAGGRAIGRILSGQANPSGRLPITFYRSVADLPAFTDYSMASRTYRYFSKPVLYPFGYGLSYSRFDYAHITLSSPSIGAGGSATVSATVTNEGERPGTEVAELYVAPPDTPRAPRLALAAYRRIQLGPHESQTVSFVVTSSQLGELSNSAGKHGHAEAYRLFLGGTQPADTAHPDFTLRVR